jgi:hypothetical protein
MKSSRALFGLLGVVLSSGAAASEPPVVMGLVLDTSGSLKPAEVQRASALATGTLAALPEGSEAAVFSFDDQSRLLLAHTADARAVESAVAALHPEGRYTALYDALFDASRYLRDLPGRRKAVVLVTDGKDENSALSIEDGLKVAQDTGIPVFCVGVGRIEERVMRRIAKLTSGDYLSLEEATGPSLASRILAAPEAEPSAIAMPSPSPTTGLAPVPSSAGSTGERWPPLLVAGGLAGLGLLLAFVLILRSVRPRPLEPRPRGQPVATVPLAGNASTEPRESPPETILARMDLGNDTVERTVFLKEKAVLAIAAGPGQGKAFPLSAESATSVGRAGANDIALEDETVSGQHFRIRPEEGRFVLHDLGSTNGTRVNDRRVRRHVLAEGDLIRAGDTALEFRLLRGR